MNLRLHRPTGFSDASDAVSVTIADTTASTNASGNFTLPQLFLTSVAAGVTVYGITRLLAKLFS